MKRLTYLLLAILLLLAAALLPGVLYSKPLSALVAQAADEPPLMHNSRDLMYRHPFGAVTTGTEITLRLRTAAGVPDSALLRVYDGDAKRETFYSMNKAVTTADYDFWEYRLKAPAKPTVLYYRFLIRKGDAVAYYEDDTKDDKGTYSIAKKGGPGMALPDTRNQNWQIAVYTPDFKTPQWMHDAVIYQIFPDRFRRSDKNKIIKDGAEMFYGSLPLTFHKTWNEMMVDFKTNPTLNPNSDFYGGDLRGIEEKLPYLKSLGVNVIYLNPIFEARSNHRYDTVDYKKIDPILGTQADWDSLVKAATAQGIRIILDGVFNHASSDGPYFDRYKRFGDQGACWNLKSEYRDWFFFRKSSATEPKGACADDGNGNTYYESWFGFDSIPKLNSANPKVRAYIYGDKDSVARYWIGKGASGWRLDVAGDIDNGSSANLYWEEFRKAVKETNPDAVIISEIWDDVSAWVTGTQFDSTMNYRMRSAVMGYTITKPFADNDVSWQPLKPSEFDGMVMAMLEDYPPQAMQAMMNLLGSHDNSRLTSVLDNDTASQRLAALLQFAMPGAPTIYYGDEIALKAPSLNKEDDPYNRAPYPWADETGSFYPKPDAEMLAYYTKLAKIRADNPALRGAFYQTLLADNTNGLYAFLRGTAGNANTALVISNRSDKDQPFSINAPDCLADGATLSEAISGGSITITTRKISGTIKARTGTIYIGEGQDSCADVPPFKVFAPSNTDPTPLFAVQGSDNRVDITFPVRNALVKYDVYRSLFPDGGFVKITNEPQLDKFSDTQVVNGACYYYYLQPFMVSDLQNARLIPERRTDVVASAPGSKITSVTFAAADTAQLVNKAPTAKGIPITVAVVIEGKQPQSVIAQMAIVPEGSDPKQATTWQSLAAGKGFLSFDGTLRPEQPGKYLAVARASANGGLTWVFSDPLSIMVAAPTSTTPPAAPANVKVASAAPFKIVLAWDAVPNVYGYRVYRGTGSERVLVAEVTEPKFTDRDALNGAEFSYTVTAIDDALIESQPSAAVVAKVQATGSTVTFRVKVPANTPSDSPIFLAGDFGSPDYPQWNPGAVNMKMADKGSGTWEITLKLPQGASVQYKYVRGDWKAVEKGKTCEEIANRQILVKGGDQVVNDEVAKWRDVDKCP